ncbi:hypothetical protein AB1Y20_000822 [Prymnesium parvum]|uniref:Ubiquitin carboxyl-terminal hydrolase n=1 Tax=Prymnesium parvum TaxID=97485 RepID=A0AB34K7S7_PRYPA
MSDEALRVLREPTLWACKVCGSTDGVWVCLDCGHVGCGRRATHPSLGGGHARHHHFATGGAHAVCIDAITQAAHCHTCDNWLLDDEPSCLGALREEIRQAQRRPFCSSPGDREITHPQRAHAPLVRGATGLANLGNTCYINAVVQALSHCAGFRAFFRDFLRASAPVQLGSIEILRQDTPKWKAQVEGGRAAELQLCSATHALLRVLWSGQWSSCSPHEFVHQFWTHVGEQFASRTQHDAQEFLIFYLNRLSEELTGEHVRSAMRRIHLDGFNLCAAPRDGDEPPDACSECSGASEPPSEGGGATAIDFIRELFGCPLRQKVRCHHCGETFAREELSLGLQLVLPPGADAVSVETCLDELVAAHDLQGDCQYHCDTCGGKQDATREVRLARPPQALLLLLNRTSWDRSGGRSKDCRRVTFPRRLALTPWLDAAAVEASPHPSPRPLVRAAQSPSGAASSSPGVAAPHSPSPTSHCYRLSSVVCHSGSSTDVGHYFSYARSDSPGGTRCWRLFNDARVSVASVAEVLSAEASVLVYENVSPDDADEDTTAEEENKSLLTLGERWKMLTQDYLLSLAGALAAAVVALLIRKLLYAHS